MLLGILVLITALTISSVAIYYSVAGLVAIFAAAAIPIMVMGGALEIGKLVTAVWLHRYWHRAKWWLKGYLTAAVVILMFITSMGIFGFLSKAHIEQTSAAQEGVAQIDRINNELLRQEEIITRAEQRIVEAEASIGAGNDAVQAQIDKEQERIDSAYDRIQPAIDEQNAVIEAARAADANRTEPYEQQLENLEAELRRLNEQATQYESRISSLTIDTSAVDPVLAQIASIEDAIVRVEGQLASRERDQIAAAQRTIGANADGNAGPNTRRAADAWITQQRARIAELQGQVATLRSTAQSTIDTERTRLTGLVSSLRGEQTQAIKTRQLEVLAAIDEVRATESPIIQTARNEIARIRAGADAQIAQSNTLIQSLRESLTIGVDAQVEATVAEQQQKILDANNAIDTLTEQKYSLQAEYRKLEAEVGPVKYLAEFIYGERADQNILEDAVRWVIVIIIFVFDPLAVLLLIASQATFEMRRQEYPRLQAQQEIKNDNESNDHINDEHTQSGSGHTGRGGTDNIDRSGEQATDEHSIDIVTYADWIGTSSDGGDVDRSRREQRYEQLEADEETKNAKQAWKADHPDLTIKEQKDLYIQGKIETLPWEEYVQNGEQNPNSIWNKLKREP
jgi:hypothetical protein